MDTVAQANPATPAISARIIFIVISLYRWSIIAQQSRDQWTNTSRRRAALRKRHNPVIPDGTVP